MYNYLEAVKDDVRNYIMENAELEDYENNLYALEDYLNDILFCEDSVTGNASGSYTFNSYKAEENICHNISLLCEALENFGYGNRYSMSRYIAEHGAEACDVTIRCYLLPQAISEVIAELEEE